MGRLFWKTYAGTAPSLRCIGRLQHSVLIKNGRSWRKLLSMSVSRGRSSKDTLQFLDPSSLNPKLRIKDLPWFLGFSSRYPGLAALQGTHWVHTVPSEGSSDGILNAA